MEAQGVEKLMTSIISGQDANVEDMILANRGFAHPFPRVAEGRPRDQGRSDSAALRVLMHS